jgi:translation initiation factor 2-alpha kinase 4
MNTSETIQRQIDELSALKAIFGTDLRDLRNSDNEKNWSPIEVEITLKPMVSMSELNKESFVQLDLYVKCGQKYPNVIPDHISFRNVKGLSSIGCQQLRSELYELAKQLRGEVMIFHFTDHCRQYLHKHNKPPLKSFYDEMVSHKTKLEIQKNLELEKKMQIIRIRDEQKHKLLEEELQRKQIASRVESKLRRESCDGNDLIHLTTNSLNDNKYYMKSSLTKCNSSHGTNCIVFTVNGIDRKVQKGKCLFHNHLRQSIEYLGIDLLSGEPVVIVEWILNLNQIKQNPLLEFELTDEKSVDDIVNRISKIENFFKTKIKSLDNSNLIRYLSLKYSIESEYIVVDLLQEHINGNSLFSLANVLRGQPLDVNLIRHYSKQILEALSYLHKQHCPHGDIRETNIYIDGMTGNIKISGYYLEKQLFDLYCDLNFDDSKPLNSNIFSTNIHRLMKRDIYQFGLLISAISSDWNFINDPNIMHFNTQFKRYNFDNELKNFLEKCIDTDENARWSSELLLNHSFILSQKTSFASNTDKKDDDSRQLSISNRKQEQPESGKNFEKNDSRVLLNSLVPSGVLHSRLANEFEVLDELGKGLSNYSFEI